MARTASTMMPLGTVAPDFSLPDVVSGRTIARGEFSGKRGLLVMFLCSHCPFVKHVERELAALGRDFMGRGLGMVAIGSNDAVAYPEDSPEGLRAQAEQQGFPFPYLYDETQAVARAYDAACTPDFFSVRCRWPAGLSRTDGWKPAGKWNSSGWPRLAGRDGSGAGRETGDGGADAEHRLRDQVEGRPPLGGCDAPA